MKIWLVLKYWSGGRRETYGAFIKEEDARWAASQIVGQDGALIALETTDFDPVASPINQT